MSETLSSEYHPERGSPNTTPIVILSVLCSLIAVWSIFSGGFGGDHIQRVPLILSALLLGFIALFEIRVGLAVLLLAIGLSPELELFGVDNFRYEDIVFPVIFLVWITKHGLTRRPFAETDLRLPILIILFLSLVSTLNNKIYGDIDLQSAVFRFGKSVVYYFIFLIVLNALRGLRDMKAFAALMLISSAFVGLYGLTQASVFQNAARVTGPPGETANVLGGYFVFHMCLATGLLTRAKGGTRLLLIGYLILMFIPFAQTLSRTSYVAFVSGFAAVWFLSKGRTLGPVMALIFLAALLSPAAVEERLVSIFGIFEGNAPSSWEARVAGWKLLLAYAINAPLLGRGVGDLPLGAVDNEYMLQLHELGVLGLFAFLWLITRTLKTSFRLHKTGQDRMATGFCLGYFAGCIALLVHSIGATTFTTIRTTEPFFFATGLLYLYHNYEKKRRLREGEDPKLEIPDTPPLIGRAMNYHDGPLIGRNVQPTR